MSWPIVKIFVIPIICVLLTGIAGFILCRWIIPRIARRVDARNEAIARREQCKCGYALKGLEVARCPECGRVVGFDATPEELGLSQDELARIQQKRQHSPRQ